MESGPVILLIVPGNHCGCVPVKFSVNTKSSLKNAGALSCHSLA